VEHSTTHGVGEIMHRRRPATQSHPVHLLVHGLECLFEAILMDWLDGSGVFLRVATQETSGKQRNRCGVTQDIDIRHGLRKFGGTASEHVLNAHRGNHGPFSSPHITNLEPTSTFRLTVSVRAGTG
jgi:hypothetical protein